MNGGSSGREKEMQIFGLHDHDHDPMYSWMFGLGWPFQPSLRPIVVSLELLRALIL
jgi:hypothetical protein